MGGNADEDANNNHLLIIEIASKQSYS